jgi:hypothetical protein
MHKTNEVTPNGTNGMQGHRNTNGVTVLTEVHKCKVIELSSRGEVGPSSRTTDDIIAYVVVMAVSINIYGEGMKKYVML